MEGTRGRQGPEGTKGDEVSLSFSLNSGFVGNNLTENNSALFRELLGPREDKVPKGTKEML